MRPQRFLECLLPVLAALLVLSAGCSHRDEGATPAAAPSAEEVAEPEAQVKPPSLPEDAQRVHVFVTGRVQGVGFRAFTQHHARELGLTGTVMNLPDGRVEAVIEGPAEKVAELLKLISRGPTIAEVEQLEVTDEPPKGDFDDFHAIY